MKAILTYKLPRENEEFIMAANASKLHSAIWDFDQWLRSEYKHHDHETIDTYDCRNKLREILNDNGVDIDGDTSLNIKKPGLLSRLVTVFHGK